MTAALKVLVLGGTRFVGRHIVLALLEAGHQVSVLTRGRSADELPPQVERLTGDRDAGAAGLTALTGRTWDACVDVSGYTPRQVRASAEALRSAIGHYLFVSTVSVYAEAHRHPVRETDPLWPPAPEDLTDVTGETYGPLKVTCEAIVQEVYAERGTLLRPQIVAGPYDHTARYPFWTLRAARAGQDGQAVLAPGDGSDHLQFIDARDLGRFVVRLLDPQTTPKPSESRIYNLAGPRLSWAAFLNMLGITQPQWVPAEQLAALGLGWQQVPLYVPEHGPQGGLMDVDASRALADGLSLTDPAVTAQDTRAWSAQADLTPALSPEQEAAALAQLLKD